MRALPVTRLRALALEVGTDDEHAGFREFLGDGVFGSGFGALSGRFLFGCI